MNSSCTTSLLPAGLAAGLALGLMGCSPDATGPGSDGAGTGDDDDSAAEPVGDPSVVLQVGAETPPCESPAWGFERFTSEPDAFGVVLDTPAELDTFPPYNHGGRVLLDDLDGDGDLDAAFGDSLSAPHVFRNVEGRFELAPQPAELPEELEPITGIEAADLDDDGLPELLLNARNGVAVMHNRGELDFAPASTLWSRPAIRKGEVSTVSAGDLDADGDLDLLVTSIGYDEDADPADPSQAGLPAYALLLEGGELVEVDEIRPFPRGISALSAIISDTDRDGAPELLFFSDGPTDSALMVGTAGDWTNVGPERYFDLRFKGMGTAPADLNLDGRLDWCVSDIGPPVCFLSYGEQDWVLSDAALGLVDDRPPPAPGAASTLGWGLTMRDFDNDSFVDLAQASGPSASLLETGGEVPMFEDRIWAGGSDGFADRTDEVQFGDTRNHLGIASGDLDGDGYPEIIVAGPGHAPILFRNRCGEEGWVSLDLVGPPGNRRGVGAQVRVFVGQVSSMAQVTTGLGPNQDPARLHFGTKMADQVDRLEVFWPDGSLQVFDELPVRRHLRIRHPEARPFPPR